jgi:hypothetical protein
MTKTTATFVALLFFCAAAKAQISVALQNSGCHTLSATVGSTASDLKENQHFICWLERQVAPGIWEMKNKKYSKSNTVLFEDVPIGIYRAGAAIGKANALIQEPIQLTTEERAARSVVEVRACGNEKSFSFNTSSTNIKLYPNPAANELHFFLSEGELMPDAQLELSSMDGKSVRSVNLTALSQAIDVSTLPMGTYIARILQGGSPILTQRIAILRP